MDFSTILSADSRDRPPREPSHGDHVASAELLPSSATPKQIAPAKLTKQAKTSTKGQTTVTKAKVTKQSPGSKGSSKLPKSAGKKSKSGTSTQLDHDRPPKSAKLQPLKAKVPELPPPQDVPSLASLRDANFTPSASMRASDSVCDHAARYWNNCRKRTREIETLEDDRRKVSELSRDQGYLELTLISPIASTIAGGW